MTGDSFLPDLPEALRGRNLDDTDPADLEPQIPREEATERLADLSARIAAGKTAEAERADLIARLAGQHWTQQQVADAAGISQAAVSKLLKSTPGSRSLAGNRSVPYLAGRLIGVALHLSRSRDTGSMRTADKLYAGGIPVTVITVQRLRGMLGRDLDRQGLPAVYAAQVAEIDDGLADTATWPAAPWALTQTAEMMLGCHHQSAAITRALATSEAASPR